MAIGHNFGTADLSAGNVKKTEKKISALEMFNTKRVAGEPDLVAIVARDIATTYGEVASAMFLNDGEISTVKELNPVSQRVIINKWFTTNLLIYRSHTDNKDVAEIMMHVINDGTVDQWFEHLRDVVILFFKKNNVLGVA